VDVGPRWQALAAAWEPLAEDGYYAFNDVHAQFAFVGAGNYAGAERVIASLERAAQGTGTNAMMSRDVGLPLARAVMAFGRGQYRDAMNTLLPVRANVHRFGGSHAQRDVVQLTLLEAALRAGQGSQARALAAERTDLKRTSPFNWRLSARALDAQGLAEEARRARDTADMHATSQRGARAAARVAA
jgi:hypothetical protein